MGAVIQVILYCAILGMVVYIGIMWRARIQENKALRGQNYVEIKPPLTASEERTKQKRKIGRAFLLAGLFGVMALAIFIHLKKRK